MKAWSLLVTCLLSCSLSGAGAVKAAFAYSEGQTIHILDARGHPLAALRVPARIGTFSIDSTANRVVVQAYGNYGGRLFWCSVEKQRCERLTHGPYYFGSEAESREVYADPSLDPTGSLVAFAVRTEFRNPAQAKEEDIVEASGPLAVMDIPQRRVRVLRSTLDKSAGGPFFANSPAWSPDGTRILFRFEVGGAISDASGMRLQDLSDSMAGSAKDSYTQPLMWLSNEAILFIRTSDGDGNEESLNQALRKSHIFRLDLATMHVRPVSRLGPLYSRDLLGAVSVQVSNALVCVETLDEVRIYDRQTGRLAWSTAESSKNPVSVQLVGK